MLAGEVPRHVTTTPLLNSVGPTLTVVFPVLCVTDLAHLIYQFLDNLTACQCSGRSDRVKITASTVRPLRLATMHPGGDLSIEQYALDNSVARGDRSR